MPFFNIDRAVSLDYSVIRSTEYKVAVKDMQKPVLAAEPELKGETGMIKIKSKTRVILGIVIIVLALMQCYRLLTLAIDLKATYLKTGLLQQTETVIQYTPASSIVNPLTLLDGVIPEVASGAYTQMYNLAGAGEKNGGAFFAEEKAIGAWLANVPDIDARKQAICDRLLQLLASFPVAAPEPTEKQYFTGMIPYVPTRTSVRFLALLAWDAARQGNAQQALLTACAPAAVGATLEIYETQTGALSVMGHALGANMGQLTGSLLRELAPMLKLSKEDAIAVLQRSDTLVNAFPSPERALANEFNFWPTFARRWKLAIDSGEAMKAVGRDPHALVELFSDQAIIDSYLMPIMTGFRQVCSEPYPQATRRMVEVLAMTEPLTRYTTSFGLNSFRMGFMPETSYREMLLGMMLPNLEVLYITSVKTRAMLRGGALAVALQAFHQEKGAWPADLGELATWLGVASLPQDPFAAAPWVYSAAEPSLLSPGPDLKADSSDDLQFLKAPR